MDSEQVQSQIQSVSSSSATPSTSLVQEGEPVHHYRPRRHRLRSSILSYRVNISISDAARTELKDDVWSCLVVLLTFWFLASTTLILGFYGSVSLQLGPNCSRLIHTNPFFAQSIQAEEQDEHKNGPVLYGFYNTPPLDVEITWTETKIAFVQAYSHEEWVHFLNRGSMVDIFYNVKSQSSSPLSLVIAQGRESLVEWIDDPSYPNSTLSWHIIYGRGKIQQKISKEANYYIAVGNFNNEKVEVELRFNINAFMYNTTQAYYKCSLGNHLCSLKLFLLGANSALLTSPSPKEGIDEDDDWYIKLSYGPRWITYLAGSGVMTALTLLTFRFCSIFQNNNIDRTIVQTEDVSSERAPLVSHKDDDVSSWGSSYDSLSHGDEDPDEWPDGGNLISEAEINDNQRRLCVVCFDAPRDSFFLPCGHCAACFTCATRIVEEAGTCPICCRKMKKVRKIFTV